jgi:hypothetical protein
MNDFLTLKEDLHKLKDPINLKRYEGNLLDSDAQYIAHQCNCITTHAAGLSKVLFEKYPWANTYITKHRSGVHSTLGTIDIRVFEASFSNAKYIGLQDATRTIGATAPNCDVTPVVNNYWNGQTDIIDAAAPKAWRFSPPSNYNTTWYANGVAMPSVTANPTATPPVVGYANPGVNVLSIPVAPVATTTYSISYTNQTTGCTNAAGCNTSITQP